MAEQKDIKYLNRDFTDFRSQLIEYTKNYFPDTYNDFSPTSPGMMFIEMASYVGDVLSFYQDTQLQETFLTHAKDPKNLFSLAYMMGYRPKTTGVSEVELEISQRIAADTNYRPKWTQAAIIGENSVYTSTDSSQTKFLVQNRVDFSFSSSFDPTTITISRLDASNNPEEYLLTKKVKAVSGEIKTTTFDIGPAEKFKTLTVEDTNIIGILDITGSSSETDIWYEVPYLAQDTTYTAQDNLSVTDNNLVPYLLSVTKVPKRFITRHLSNGNLQIQFGPGTNSTDDSVILPDPNNVGLGSDPLLSQLNKAYDPKNFLYSKSYGIAPSNTTLRVRYLKGGGVNSNIPARTLTVASSANTVTSAGGDGSRLSSAYLTFTNPNPASGGREGDSVDELRENIIRAFNEQSRTVTLQDYAIRVLSLPPKYGSVAKVYVTQDQLTNSNLNPLDINSNNPFALNLYVLSYNNSKKLIKATKSLKTNIQKYLSEYIMITDSVNIKDAFVVNVAITYDILILPNYSSRDILLTCNNVLKDYFDITKWSINQPINLSEVYRLLDRVPGVQTVQNVSIENRNKYQHGANYSENAYDITGATLNNVIYPSFDPSIFEVKFPNQDIKGRILTL
jgi:hypothetical protein